MRILFALELTDQLGIRCLRCNGKRREKRKKCDEADEIWSGAHFCLIFNAFRQNLERVRSRAREKKFERPNDIKAP